MSTTSPNMFMTVPTVGVTVGPDYALNINSDLNIIDSHDHSLGKGVQITPSGLNINSTLSLNSNDLSDVGGIAFTALSANPSTTQFLYVSPGVETPLTEDLWFNDGNGNQVQITSNGLVNATIASLPGESYAGGTFFWVQGAGSTTPANFDIGSITIRPNIAATTNGVRLTPPSGISSQYDIALPLLPASQSIMTISASGVISTPDVYPLTNASIAVGTITGNRLVNQTITATQIANDTITTTQISPTAGITGGQLATGTVAQSNLASRTTNQNGGAVAGGVAISNAFTFTNQVNVDGLNTYTFAKAAQTATVSVASPAIVGVASTTGLFVGQPVTFTTTGALPTGITAGTPYYISNIINATTFNVSATPGGSNVNTSGTQSGVHTETAITSCVALTQLGTRPVQFMLTAGGSTTGSSIDVVQNSTVPTSFIADIGVFDSATSSTPIAVFALTVVNTNSVLSTQSFPPSSVAGIATNLSAGVKNYIIKAKVNTGGGNNAHITLTDVKLVAFEL